MARNIIAYFLDKSIKNSIFQCATFKKMDLNNKIKEKLTMED